MQYDQLLWPTAVAILTGVLGFLGGQGLERTRSRRPLSVHIEQDTSIIFGSVPDWASFPYYFNCDRDHLPTEPPSCGVDWWGWASPKHGLPAVHSEIALTVSARTEQTVVVDSFRVRVLEKIPAPAGSIVVHPVGGADIVHAQASVELSSMAPVVRFLEAGSAEERTGFTFALAKGEPARISVTTRALDHRYLYKWLGLIDIVVGARRRTIEISNHGQPFVLHGGGNCSEFEWLNGDWVASSYLPTD